MISCWYIGTKITWLNLLKCAHPMDMTSSVIWVIQLLFPPSWMTFYFEHCTVDVVVVFKFMRIHVVAVVCNSSIIFVVDIIFWLLHKMEYFPISNKFDNMIFKSGGLYSMYLVSQNKSIVKHIFDILKCYSQVLCGWRVFRKC